MVSQLRAIGRDPALQAETIAAAAVVRQERRAELREQERQARSDLARLDGERERVSRESGNGPEVAQRQAALDDARDDAARRLNDAQGETHALTGAVLRKADLRAALCTFEVWDHLVPAEQRRVVHLLLEGVAYHGPRGELSLTYRPGGVLELAAESAS